MIIRISKRFLQLFYFYSTDFFLYVYADFANYVNYDWTKYPKLNAVFDNIKSLPYHNKVNSKCLSDFNNLVKDKRNRL